MLQSYYLCFGFKDNKSIFVPLSEDNSVAYDKWPELFFSVGNPGPSLINLERYPFFIQNQIKQALQSGILKEFKSQGDAETFLQEQNKPKLPFPQQSIDRAKRILEKATLVTLKEALEATNIATLLIKEKGSFFFLGDVLLYVEEQGKRRRTIIKYLRSFNERKKRGLGELRGLVGLDSVINAAMQHKRNEEYDLGEDILDIQI